jgi:hypothetical protein
MGKGAIIGIAIAGCVLIVGFILAAMYALRQRRIAKEAVERTTNPFGMYLTIKFQSNGRCITYIHSELAVTVNSLHTKD